MQITGGIAKGIRLDVLPGDRTRPTTDRVRESVFASLSAFVPEAVVLDLFAGSGALGLEAVSRGAKSVTFVEAHAATADLLRKNAEKCKPAGVEAEMQVVCRKTEPFLRIPSGPVDLVLIDPPYSFFEDAAVLKTLWDLLAQPGWLSEESLVVIEHPKHKEPGCGEDWRVLKNKEYGGTQVSFVEIYATHTSSMQTSCSETGNSSTS